MKENIILNKSKKFALKIIKLYKILCNENKEFVISKQILRSGTSIGANIREAIFGQTKADFYFKMNIARKEANETEYWLELLNESDYIDAKNFKELSFDCKEIIKLLTSITKTQKIDSIVN